MRSSLVAAAVALLSLVVVSSAAAKAPTAVTGVATSVGATTAVVEGKVDAGGEATSWYVEYGTSTGYGSRTGARSGGNGTSAVDVTEQLRGLTTGATYHYRLVASNGAGTSRGADQTFSTRAAPTVVTSPAWSLGPTSASVGGTVDPNGRSTGWWIEYGTSTRYGSRTDTQSAGSGSSAVSVSVRLTGFKAGVTYHVRLVASNDLGTTRGADRSFRTDLAPSVSTGGADGISVSSARIGGAVNPQGRGSIVWFEYGTTSALGTRTGDQDAGYGTRLTRLYAQLTGLQPGAKYYYRVAARSDAGTTVGKTRSFTTSAGPLRGHRSRERVGCERRSHRDGGSRRPGDELVVQLGPTTAYGTTTVVRSAGTGRGPIAVSETVPLTLGADYHVRLVARSPAGTTRGVDVTFRTAGVPAVGRSAVWGVSLARARIDTDVATSGLETSVWIELFRRGAFVSRTRTLTLPAAGGAGRVSLRVSGLTAGARYTFRVVARNVAGTATGASASFGTAARPRDEHGRLLRCTIVGTNGADRLVGTGRRDVICGLGGADVLVGRGGDDVLVGGPGKDYLLPGTGRDVVLAGGGNDFVSARDRHPDRIVGGYGADRARVDRRVDQVLSARRLA